MCLQNDIESCNARQVRFAALTGMRAQERNIEKQECKLTESGIRLHCCVSVQHFQSTMNEVKRCHQNALIG